MADQTYCPYCGASMREGASFCPSCGAQIAQQNVSGVTGAPAPETQYGQQYNEKVKAQSSLKTIGIFTIILAVIGVIEAISMFFSSANIDMIDYSAYVSGDLTVDKVKSIFQGAYIYLGVIMILLAIVGAVAASCCMKRQNYERGRTMYIIALILNIISIGGGCLGLGIIFAVLLLIFYTKTKPAFE